MDDVITLTKAKKVAGHVRRWKMAFNIIWIAFGFLQVVTILAAAAGLWNIINAAIAISDLTNIREGNPSIYFYYETSKKYFLTIALINIFLGGFIGIIFVVGELFLRSYVLKHKAAFFDHMIVPE